VDVAPITLIVDTEAGVLVREIPNASPLRDDIARGVAAEEATHDAAALWGLPDFVYDAQIRRVGVGSREIGDCLLLVGGLGVVVQVKSRNVSTSDEEKERRWIEKKAAQGLDQANGTIRQLKRAPASMTNGRNRTVEIDGNAVRWLIAVVIDHPDVPAGIIPDLGKSQSEAVVVLRGDWEFLFEQLKSTYAVARYFERVAGEPMELGQEPIRYFKLANADHEASPEPVHPKLLTPNSRQLSSPLLPLLPAASEDRMAHLLVRSIFEDIATHGLTQVSETMRLRVLAELDRFPVSDRGAEVGRYLLEALGAVVKAPSTTTEWRLRSAVGSTEGERVAHLCFGACSKFSDLHLERFSWWVQLRHSEIQQVMALGATLNTVGVLLTPRTDGERPWDTTMVAAFGDLGLTKRDLSAYRSFWGNRSSPGKVIE